MRSAMPVTGPVAAGRRVTVITPEARVDVTLPGQSTVAELLPQLVRMSRAGHLSRSPGGWVLSRLGDTPLSPGLTVSAAGLRDGDVLCLNPRESQAPPMMFDDVVDAIASATQGGPGAWGPRAARQAGIAGGGLVLLGAVILLLAYLSGKTLLPLAAGGAAVLLLFGGGALSRGNGDGAAGAVTATAAVAAAAIAGLSLLAPHHAWRTDAGPLALGLAAVAVCAVLALVIAGSWPAWFACLAVAAGLGAVAAVVPAMTAVTPTQAAAVLAIVATALTAAVPIIAVRLSGLPLPRVPSDIEAFRNEEQPVSGPAVFSQTAVAQRLLAGLLGALGLAVAGSVVVLLQGSQADRGALAGLLGLVWLLRSRSYARIAQRFVLLGTGLVSLALASAWLVAHHSMALPVAVALLIVAGLASVVYAGRVTTGRRSPYWTRMMDVAEFLGILALLPVTGLVLNIFTAIRHAVH